MSKKSRRKAKKVSGAKQRENSSLRKSKKRQRLVFFVIALSLSLVTAGLTQPALFRRSATGVRSWFAPAPAPSPDSFAASNPSKEYIYAGGRLVATEAPSVSPAAPTFLQVMWCDHYLTWADNSTNESGFKVERSTDGTNFSTFTTLPANENFLWMSASGYFRVRAINSAGDSGPSNTVQAVPPCSGANSQEQIKSQEHMKSPEEINCRVLCPEGTPTSPDTIWVDDNLPDGANPAGEEAWSWLGSNPDPFSRSLSSQSAILGGMHQHYFYGATQTLTVNTGETLIAYVYLDPANLPSQVMLQWNDGSWEHRAYWGANNIGWGVDGTNSRRYMGALPASGQWVRLAVPASQVGLQGSTLNGAALTLFGGRANWDYIGKSTRSPSSGNLAPPTGLFATASSGPQVSISWTTSTSTIDHYQVERSQYLNTGYTVIASNVTATSFNDTSVSSGSSYLYRVCAVDAAGNHSAYSNVDLATAITFTDDPLVAGGTTIKAQHIFELRQAVNAVRLLAGLSAASWTDSYLSGVTIKAVHIQELRNMLDQAFNMLGLPVSSYADPWLAGVVVKKAHVEEIRQRVK